ncbi:hypothetical protein VEE24_27010 [Escherichia coli]|nr:hypothetical protein VEE24_27010 [Escherichia coli]
MIWQPEFTDKTLSRKPGAVHLVQAEILAPEMCREHLYGLDVLAQSRQLAPVTVLDNEFIP